MIKCLMTTVLAATLIAPAADAAIKHRQQRQRARVAQGVASGQLTFPEARRLNRARHDLNRTIHRDRIDGGGLTIRERVKIDRRQDRLSQRIYRQKHDAQHR